VPAAVTDQLGACAPGGADRISGPDRAATAATLSAAAFPDGAQAAMVVSGHGFADALAAGPAAARVGAPLLLTGVDDVPAATLTELRRLAPERITLAGGFAAVSADVEQALSEIAPVDRVAGVDRYATAAALAPAEAPTVWVATGTGWADALSAGPAAGLSGAPILLVTRTEVPAATREALAGLTPEQIVVVGGTAAIADTVVDELQTSTGANLTRLAGADRFATAAAVADHAFPEAGAVLVATGAAPPDALAAVPVAVRKGAPLLLVSGPSLPPPTVATLQRLHAITCRQVRLEPGPAERLAVGGPVTLTAAGPTGTVPMGATGVGLLLPGGATLHLTYPTPQSGGPPLAWSQDVSPDAVHVEVSQPWRGERPPAPSGITLAWHANGSWDRYRDELAAAPGLTVSAPVSLRLDADGSLVGSVDAGFVAAARSKGVDVWATVASLDAGVIRAALADPARRGALAAELSERARSSGARGVNIDLEGWTHDTTEAVTDFTRQVTAHVHSWGGVTSIDLVSMSDTWATPPTDQYGHWSTAPQRRELSEGARPPAAGGR
jgi:putative cell wall-binding protein